MGLFPGMNVVDEGWNLESWGWTDLFVFHFLSLSPPSLSHLSFSLFVGVLCGIQMERSLVLVCVSSGYIRVLVCQ